MRDRVIDPLWLPLLPLKQTQLPSLSAFLPSLLLLSIHWARFCCSVSSLGTQPSLLSGAALFHAYCCTVPTFRSGFLQNLGPRRALGTPDFDSCLEWAVSFGIGPAFLHTHSRTNCSWPQLLAPPTVRQPWGCRQTSFPYSALLRAPWALLFWERNWMAVKTVCAMYVKMTGWLTHRHREEAEVGSGGSSGGGRLAQDTQGPQFHPVVNGSHGGAHGPSTVDRRIKGSTSSLTTQW